MFYTVDCFQMGEAFFIQRIENAGGSMCEFISDIIQNHGLHILQTLY